jgi:hypothetical protein
MVAPERLVPGFARLGPAGLGACEGMLETLRSRQKTRMISRGAPFAGSMGSRTLGPGRRASSVPELGSPWGSRRWFGRIRAALPGAVEGVGAGQLPSAAGAGRGAVARAAVGVTTADLRWGAAGAAGVGNTSMPDAASR